jgi:serine phosphatase RsbU (regulator of sigma subunit)
MVARRNRHHGCEAILESIVQAALDFAEGQLQMDDMTLIVLKRG